MTPIGQVWGIGRQFAQKLDRKGARTALDLVRLPDEWVRKEMGVQGLRTVLELRGEDCIGSEDMPQPKQSTMVSRSFGNPVTTLEDLVDAIIVFATDAARSIRTANRVCSSVHVFIETNRFSKDPPYAPSRLESLSPPTHNTRHIVGAALKGLREIYREGLAYKRAGVMLLDLVDARQAQASLFDRPDLKDDRLIDAMDAIEGRMGPGSIRFGLSGSAAQRRVSVAPLYDPVGRYPGRENLSIGIEYRKSQRRSRGIVCQPQTLFCRLNRFMATALEVFTMPTSVKITGRTSTITNAFVNAIIPAVRPTEAEVTEALDVLGISPDTISCAYCGNTKTEGDTSVLWSGKNNPPDTFQKPRIWCQHAVSATNRRAAGNGPPGFRGTHGLVRTCGGYLISKNVSDD